MADREKNGRFSVGNNISKNKFQTGNTFSAKYDPIYCEKIIEYFSEPITSEHEDLNGKTYSTVNDFPTIYGFAASIHVVSKTLKNWRMEHKEFDEACAQAEEIQRHKLMSGSVSGKYNPMMSKFLASAWYGLSEKTTSDTQMTIEVKLPKDAEEESE